MATGFGPLDEVMGQLLETWDHRYTFEFDREQRVITFSRGDMIAGAGEVAGGLIRVAYESAPGEVVEEFCTPTQAAALVDGVMGRERLCRVPKPDA
jgi:hypothetical protein